MRMLLAEALLWDGITQPELDGIADKWQGSGATEPNLMDILGEIPPERGRTLRLLWRSLHMKNGRVSAVPYRYYNEVRGAYTFRLINHFEALADGKMAKWDFSHWKIESTIDRLKRKRRNRLFGDSKRLKTLCRTKAMESAQDGLIISPEHFFKARAKNHDLTIWGLLRGMIKRIRAEGDAVKILDQNLSKFEAAFGKDAVDRLRLALRFEHDHFTLAQYPEYTFPRIFILSEISEIIDLAIKDLGKTRVGRFVAAILRRMKPNSALTGEEQYALSQIALGEPRTARYPAGNVGANYPRRRVAENTKTDDRLRRSHP